MKHKFSVSLSLALIMAMLVTSLALADNLQGDDLTAGGNATKFPGQGGTAAFWLVANGNDGCNADSSNPVTVSISSNQYWLTIVSSTSIIGCGQANTVTVGYSVASNAPVGGVATVQGIASGGKSGNNGFNNNPGDFTVTVVAPPNTPPTLNLPGNITAEATSATGAVVNYSVSATDAEDEPDPTPSCSPASGSTFALGTTTVNCSVTDSGGLSTSGSFIVTVQDTTPPVVTVPADITAEATGPSGAVVSFSALASDNVDGALTPTCSPVSGSTFALGTTSVTCSATDAAGNTGSASFNVTVVDTTPPTLTLPANMTVPATSPAGAFVTFSASANDLVDGPVPVICSPASGLIFAPGITTVNCLATDAHGNTASGSFTVWVKYQLLGFYQPVDMGSGIWNTVKGGSTVPFKFEVFAGPTELTEISVVKSFAAKAVACPSGAVTTDEIEFTTTGGTSLRYDWTAGQFINNWQTPKKSGVCYLVTMTTQDGSSLEANFKLK